MDHGHVLCVISIADTPLLVQLSILDVGRNLLEGTLPESWSNITSVVSHCLSSVHLMNDVAPFRSHAEPWTIILVHSVVSAT